MQHTQLLLFKWRDPHIATDATNMATHKENARQLTQGVESVQERTKQ